MAQSQGTASSPSITGVPELENAYKYQQLSNDSIRLLKLGPGIPGMSDPITCEIAEVQLCTQPEYEAISYTWGEYVSAAILVTPAGLIKIPPNLAIALKYLPLRGRPRYLWADSVCINQADITERSSQVAMMGEIFRQARSVLVWLGPGDERTGHVFDLFRTLSFKAKEYGVDQASIDTAERPWQAFADGPTQRGRLDTVAIDYDFNGMDELYSNPWFQRLWVVQEVALAREIHVYCGKHDIPWRNFVTAATIQFKSVNRSTLSNLRLPHGFGAALTIFNARSAFKGPFEASLLRNLAWLRNNRCSVDLDHVYALLNLRGPRDPDIYPDYSKSVQEVYISAAQAIARSQVQLLAYAGVAPRLSKPSLGHDINSDADNVSRIHQLCGDLPSWVPDWRIRGAHSSFFFSSSGVFSAATEVQGQTARYKPAILGVSQSEMVPCGAILDVKGLVVDIIRLEEGIGSLESLDLEQVRSRVLRIKNLYDSQKGKVNVSGEDAITTFARTIIADFQLASSKEYIRQSYSKEDLVAMWLRFESTPYKSWEEDSTRLHPDKYPQSRPVSSEAPIHALSTLFGYRLALREALRNRTFFFTNNGRVGLAPGMVRSGDVVVLIAGLAVPLILRPAQRPCPGTYLWYLIGDCYYHGIMYGELLKTLDPESAKKKWRIFSLA